MTYPITDLVFHPVRIRLLARINQCAPATTSELAALFPDVSQRTLYRHLDELLKGGLIRVAKSERVRGAVERYYELARPTLLNNGEMQSLTPNEWRKFFIFVTSLLHAEFSDFVEERHSPEGLPGSHLRLGEIMVTPEQMASLIAETLARSAELEASASDNAERENYRISLIAFPLTKSTSSQDKEP